MSPKKHFRWRMSIRPRSYLCTLVFTSIYLSHLFSMLYSYSDLLVSLSQLIGRILYRFIQLIRCVYTFIYSFIVYYLSSWSNGEPVSAKNKDRLSKKRAQKQGEKFRERNFPYRLRFFARPCAVSYLYILLQIDLFICFPALVFPRARKTNIYFSQQRDTI